MACLINNLLYFSSIPTSRLVSLDKKNMDTLESEYGAPLPTIVYFNKGL